MALSKAHTHTCNRTHSPSCTDSMWRMREPKVTRVLSVLVLHTVCMEQVHTLSALEVRNTSNNYSRLKLGTMASHMRDFDENMNEVTLSVSDERALQRKTLIATCGCVSVKSASDIKRMIFCV